MKVFGTTKWADDTFIHMESAKKMIAMKIIITKKAPTIMLILTFLQKM